MRILVEGDSVFSFLTKVLRQKRAGIRSKIQAVLCRYLFIGVEIFVLDYSNLIGY